MATLKATKKVIENGQYSEWYIHSCDKSGEAVDMKFVAWMNRVEKHVMDRLGCSIIDLPDENYRISFENGNSPKDMASYVVQNNSYLVEQTR